MSQHIPSDRSAAASAAASMASTSSFYGALRILPASQREAMYQIYAFCRAVDDIADRSGARDARVGELGQWRQDIDDLYHGRDTPTHLRGLSSVIRTYGLEQQDFDAIIDGMLMDAERDIRAPDWATLDLYCDRVASAVGRLSVHVFDVPPDQGRPLAHHLGRALQLTNILRDLDEDAAIGRVYLPREALAEAGIEATEPSAVVADPRLAQACALLIARAREHFAQAARVMDACRRAVVRSPRVMSLVYSDILDRIEQRGFAPPRPRVRVSKTRLMLTVLRHGVV
ncbi:MAG TPA: presqualene diphosphate synthase HpnD [Burkholderiaceae bacterium]